jgi:hypothetical protein
VKIACVISPSLNVNLTLFVIICTNNLGIIDLQCCNYGHFLKDSPSKFYSFLTIIHYINVRMQNIPKVDESKVSLDDNICKAIHEK